MGVEMTQHNQPFIKATLIHSIQEKKERQKSRAPFQSQVIFSHMPG